MPRAEERREPRDLDKVRDALAATKDFAGVTGKITIDAKRDATKPMVILQIKDGAFKLIDTINP